MVFLLIYSVQKCQQNHAGMFNSTCQRHINWGEKKSQARNKVQLLSAEESENSMFVNNLEDIPRAHIQVLDQALDMGEPMSAL